MSNSLPLECACTGVRWCAACLDDAIRARRKMGVPLAPPALLAAVAQPAVETGVGADVGAVRVEDGRDIHAFDVASGCAPTLKEFAGVRVIPDLLSPDEAERLIEQIDRSPFVPSQSGREKQHFGARVNFNRRRMNVKSFPGLPDFTHPLVERARARLREAGDAALDRAVDRFDPTDVFVLRYAPERRSNLDLHLDDVFAYGELILDLSLESDSVLTFYRGRPGGEVSHADGATPPEACVRVPMPARSLVAIHGPARFAWEHGILARDIRARRTSITLRTLSESLRETDQGRWLLDACRAPDPTPASIQASVLRASAS